MMNHMGARKKALVALAIVLAPALAIPAIPALAQDNAAEMRIRRMEAEVRALQRQVFPGADGKVFAPQLTQGTAAASGAASPATTPVTDMLGRMDALEAQVARLTSQSEENANKLRLLEAKVTALSPAATSATTPATTPAPAILLPTPAATPTPKPAAVTPTPAPTPRPAAASGPTAARLAAVRAIVKPQTNDPGDDEYSYGYRLYDAKFFPEAQQQLKLFLDRYPRHARVSYARNLLGRAFLDDAKPRDAAPWFLQNYQGDKTGPRAPDSLLFLAESMSRLKDTSRACIALAEFRDGFAAEAAGRLKAQYDATRASVKCN